VDRGRSEPLPTASNLRSEARRDVQDESDPWHRRPA
jgi:hypothetical protein